MLLAAVHTSISINPKPSTDPPTVSLVAALTLLVQLAAMALPEWTVETSPSSGWPPANSLDAPDPDATAADSPYVAPPLPGMKAHVGLFYVAYRQPGAASDQEAFHGFCSGLSPAYSVDKCLIWRASQAAALGAGGLAYPALVLLLVGASGTVQTHAVEYTLSWAWTLLFTGGILAWGSALAFFLLTLVFRREHRARKDGYQVEVGPALLLMAAVGAVYILMPFFRMLLHKHCRPFAPVGGPVRDSIEPGSSAEEEVEIEVGYGAEDEKGGGERGEGVHGKHRQQRPHHQYPRHHHHYRRRQSRELAEAPTAATAAMDVVVDGTAHVMNT